MKDLTSLISSLQTDVMYECPVDVFGHAREYKNAQDASDTLLGIKNYWYIKGIKCTFDFGATIMACPVWNRVTLKYETKDVIRILMDNKQKFKPDFALD